MIASTNDDTRNKIVDILSEESPLSFKKLSIKLRKKYAITVTNSAIYKLIAYMIKEKILTKKEGEYSINSEWLDNIDKFKDKVVSRSIKDNMQNLELVNLAKQECSCEKGSAEGFCYVCNEPVCSQCGEKTRMHYSCSTKCKNCEKESRGKCVSCLRDACSECSKEVWAHHPDNCIKNPDKIIVGILEVTHKCWFADLSGKLKNPIMLNSFIDEKDKELGTHSGSISIENSDRKVALSHIIKHKQIVEVKPIYANGKLVLRTRALFNKSVEDFIRTNKSILLNPVLAYKSKERNLIVSPSYKEIEKLLKGLSKYGKCKITASEEIEVVNLASPKSKEIITFIKSVDKKDLENAAQKVRVMRRL